MLGVPCNIQFAVLLLGATDFSLKARKGAANFFKFLKGAVNVKRLNNTGPISTKNNVTNLPSLGNEMLSSSLSLSFVSSS